MKNNYRLLNAKNKALFLSALAFLFLSPACSNDDKTAVSTSGVSLYYLGVSAIYGGDSLPADGSSQATIMVEVWNSSGTYVDAVAVTLSASLGTLAATTLTTVDGVATTTFTAGSERGAAYVNVVVENATASVKIALSSFGSSGN